MTSSTGTETYTVNLLDQLTGVTYPDGRDVSYGYDAAGNVPDPGVVSRVRARSMEHAERLSRFHVAWSKTANGEA